MIELQLAARRGQNHIGFIERGREILRDVVGVIAKTNPNASTPAADGAKGPIDVKDVTDLLERFAKVVLHGKTDEAKTKFERAKKLDPNMLYVDDQLAGINTAAVAVKATGKRKPRVN